MRIQKMIMVAIAAALTLAPAFGKGSSGHASGGKVHVKSYTRKNGTRVQSHDRTAPNKTQRDNWSAKGNVNPETGKAGTKEPTH